MKRAANIAILVVSLIITIFSYSRRAGAQDNFGYQNEPNGFRGIQWGAHIWNGVLDPLYPPPETISSLLKNKASRNNYPSSIMGAVGWKCTGEINHDLSMFDKNQNIVAYEIYDKKAEEYVCFAFLNEKLFMVLVKPTVKNRDLYEALTQKYGTPHNELIFKGAFVVTQLQWLGKNTNIYMEPDIDEGLNHPRLTMIDAEQEKILCKMLDDSSRRKIERLKSKY